MPALPRDCLRMIWARVWRMEAARTIQRAVRRAIARAGGNPWDLPGLVDMNEDGPPCMFVFAHMNLALAAMQLGDVIDIEHAGRI
jgi:hypothetical protein